MIKKIFTSTSVILFLLIPCFPAKNAETKLKSTQKRSGKIALLDTLKVSSKTRVIGKCYNHENPYDLYSFLLKDSTSIAQFAKSLEAGKKVTNRIMVNNPEFDIDIVDDYLVTNHIAIDPSEHTIRMNGNTYEFDFGQIDKIYKKQPLICDEKKINFKNKNEVDEYVTELKKDTNLLYYFLPEFKYEGGFTMTVKKSELFSSPKAVMGYLTPYIEKIVSDGEYLMSYLVDMNQIDKVIRSDSYTITVSGSKKLFDSLNVDQAKKDNWKYYKEVGFFYMKRQTN